MRYRQFTFFSMLHDEHMVRLVIFDAHGAEYFALIPRNRPTKFRERRAAALGEVAAAIDAGYPPGEVRVDA